MNSAELLHRRQLLAAVGLGGIGLVVGCVASPAIDRSSMSTSPGARGGLDSHGSAPFELGGAVFSEYDVGLVVAALDDEVARSAAFEAARVAYPRLADTVGLAAARQREHVAALRRALVELPARQRSHHGPLPRTPSQVVARLSNLSESGRIHRLGDCLGSESGLVARLMAAVSASHAVNLVVLGGAGGSGGGRSGGAGRSGEDDR
ncbi:MAG: hypothetical protein WKF82_09950 [Nocardioidaceae bacterium]